jgi:hypothetical protein
VHLEHFPPKGRSTDDDGPRRSVARRRRGPKPEGLAFEKKSLLVDSKHQRVDEKRHRVEQEPQSFEQVTLRVDPLSLLVNSQRH